LLLFTGRSTLFYNRLPGEKVEDFLEAFEYQGRRWTDEVKKQMLPLYLDESLKKWYEFYTFGKNMNTVSWREVKEAMLAAFRFVN
jgi:hypothetical protein